MKIIFQLFLIFIFIPQISFSQGNSFKFKRITIEDGLSSNSVNDVIQDRKGFLWLGTEEGLNRYDGFSFKKYKHKINETNSLSHNNILSLCEDKDGIIWIGTDGGGLNKFDPVTEKFTHYKHNPEDSTSIGNDIVQYVYVDKNNTVWAGTWGGGLCRFNREENNFKSYIHNPDDETSIRSNKIFTIFEDSENNLWVGTDGGGASILNRENGKFTHFIHEPSNPNSISSNNIVCITEDNENNLWFGTYGGGLCRYNKKENKFTTYKNSSDKNSVSQNHIWEIFQDSRGVIWVGTLSNGLNIFNPETNSFIRLKNNPLDPNSISSDYSRKMFEDKSGVLWIGTIAGGLNKIDRKPEKFYQIKNVPDNPNSLSKNFIYAICEDSYGDIWFGTYQKELNRYNPVENKFTHYSSNPSDPSSLNGSMVRCIYEDSYGDLWIGTYFGSLQKFDRKNNSFIRIDLSDMIKENESVINVRSIYEDKDKILWFGTNGGGLLKYDRERNKFKRYSIASGLSNEHILSVCEDNEGYLWIGTYGGGLNKFDKEKETFVHYTTDPENENSISDNVITHIYLDTKGELWIGTYFGGLNKYDKQNDSFIHYTEEDGFASNLICSIIEDGEHLWISTIRGITKFNPSTGSIRNYDKSSGAPGEYNPGAGFKTRNGLIYFGGIDGVTYFDPDKVYDNSFVPEVVFTSFKKQNNEITFSKNIVYVDSIILSYNDNFFSIEFAALDFTDPGKNQYKYLLEGFDDAWIDAGNHNIANYTNIDPGEYVFKVKGSNNDGIWNEKGASVLIIIKPPFWATWWFRGIIFVAFVAAVGFFYKRRIANLEKEKRAHEEFSKRLIQSQEEERKRIASELHDSIGQNLLIIKNYALLGKKSDQQTVIKNLDQIANSASSTIDEVRRIAYNLHPYHLERLGLTNAVLSIIDNAEASSQINFEINSDNIDNIFSKDSEINFFRIIQECINNIIKHSQASNAWISIQKKEKEVLVKIKDNGKGFFSNLSLNDGVEGYGLKNIEKRIHIIKGEIKINSEPGNGTEVLIKAPVEKQI